MSAVRRAWGASRRAYGRATQPFRIDPQPDITDAAASPQYVHVDVLGVDRKIIAVGVDRSMRLRPRAGPSAAVCDVLVAQTGGSDRAGALDKMILWWAQCGHEKSETSQFSMTSPDIRKRCDLRKCHRRTPAGTSQTPTDLAHNPWVLGSSGPPELRHHSRAFVPPRTRRRRTTTPGAPTRS